MRILVTGSAGHLGEALMRILPERGHEAIGLDIVPGPFTDVRASVADRPRVRDALRGIDAVLHTATLHKPHVDSHAKQAFVEANVTGTLVLAEEAARSGVGAFVCTSTTSAFGNSLRPAAGEPAAWVTERVVPRPRNVYGVTKVAAEDLCLLVHRDAGLPVVVLRTSRFFPEIDDDAARRERVADDANLKTLELLYRRVDLADAVDAHLLAIEHAPQLRFDRFIVSATTPLAPEDAPLLRDDAATVVARRCGPLPAEVFARRGWTFDIDIDRVYDNTAARERLGWEPRHTFDAAVRALAGGEEPSSEVARAVGAKGYHDRPTGVYTPADARTITG